MVVFPPVDKQLNHANMGVPLTDSTKNTPPAHEGISQNNAPNILQVSLETIKIKSLARILTSSDD